MDPFFGDFEVTRYTIRGQHVALSVVPDLDMDAARLGSWSVHMLKANNIRSGRWASFASLEEAQKAASYLVIELDAVAESRNELAARETAAWDIASKDALDTGVKG